MRTLKKLQTEKELNEVLKKRKNTSFSVLYYSLWDRSNKRIISLAQDWVTREGDETVYLVNSWDLPASFSSFSISTAPSLVHLAGRKVKVDVEYPTIYNFFTDARRGTRPRKP